MPDAYDEATVRAVADGGLNRPGRLRQLAVSNEKARPSRAGPGRWGAVAGRAPSRPKPSGWTSSAHTRSAAFDWRNAGTPAGTTCWPAPGQGVQGPSQAAPTDGKVSHALRSRAWIKDPWQVRTAEPRGATLVLASVPAAMRFRGCRRSWRASRSASARHRAAAFLLLRQSGVRSRSSRPRHIPREQQDIRNLGMPMDP